MSTWRKAMTYLGLGPEDEYDDYAAGPDERQFPPTLEPPARPQPPVRPTGTVRPQPPASGPVLSTPPDPTGAVRPLPPPPASAAIDDLSKPRVRAAPRRQSASPVLVVPSTFNQAQEVGDAFKSGRAVAMDIGDADRDLARRLIDFSAGLCYALGGNMDRVSPNVYLVVPQSVEVSAEDRARLARHSVDD